MAVTVGQKAPDFTLVTRKDGKNSKVTLGEHKGKNIVLLFFPLAFTGVCTKELCSASEGLEMYESLNAEVWGISVDSPFSQEIFAQKNNITVPLLSDFNKEVSRAYGASYEVFLPGDLDMQGVAKRSAFVIDKEGVIRYAEVLESAGNLPNFDAIRSTLQSLA